MISAGSWSIIGLVLSLVGVVLLFIFGMPFRVRTEGRSVRVLLQTDEKRVAAEKTFTVLSYVGLAFVVLGTFCQGVGSYLGDQPPSTAQAADTLTLTCNGSAHMSGHVGDTGPVSMGLVVDVARRTVHGFREQFDKDGSEAELKITEVKEASLVLRGRMESIIDLSGFMDRMTGDMTVTATQRPPVVFTKTYTLKCKPTQRMF